MAASWPGRGGAATAARPALRKHARGQVGFAWRIGATRMALGRNMPFGKRPQRRTRRVPQHPLLAHGVDGRARRCRRDRVATVGAPERRRRALREKLWPGRDPSHGHPRRNALGEDHHVGPGAPQRLVRPPLPRAAHPRLHLVKDEQDGVPVADLPEPLEEALRAMSRGRWASAVSSESAGDARWA